MSTAYQRAVREQKLAAEVSAANKERDFYLSRVDRAKALEAQQARKRKVQPPLAYTLCMQAQTLLDTALGLICCCILNSAWWQTPSCLISKGPESRQPLNKAAWII